MLFLIAKPGGQGLHTGVRHKPLVGLGGLLAGRYILYILNEFVSVKITKIELMHLVLHW